MQRSGNNGAGSLKGAIAVSLSLIRLHGEPLLEAAVAHFAFSFQEVMGGAFAYSRAKISSELSDRSSFWKSS